MSRHKRNVKTIKQSGMFVGYEVKKLFLKFFYPFIDLFHVHNFSVYKYAYTYTT